jgi:hypothetical protein
MKYVRVKSTVTVHGGLYGKVIQKGPGTWDHTVAFENANLTHAPDLLHVMFMDDELEDCLTEEEWEVGRLLNE